MKISTTFFLALLLSGLSVYYFMWSKPIPEPGVELAPIKVLTLEAEDSLSFLEIQSPASQETISLKRKGSDWTLVSPVSYPAENFLVEGMAQALTFSRRQRRFPAGEKEGKEFGFDSAGTKVGIKTEKDLKLRRLLLGNESPVGTGIYARWEGEDEVFLVTPEFKASFNRTVYSLRQKKLFRLPWNEVTWLYAKGGGKKFRIEKKGEKWHWVLPPLEKEIPVEKATDLIYSFQSLYIREFLDQTDPAQKELGLEAREVFLAAGGKGGTEDKVAVGAAAKGKDALYGLREKENLVLLVSEQNLKSLLELFEVTFQELQSGDQGKTQENSRADSKGFREGREKPL